MTILRDTWNTFAGSDTWRYNFVKNYPLYEHTLVPTLKELVAFCAEKYGSRPAFQYTNRKTDVVVDYIQFQAEVEALGTYFFSCGCRHCHIAVFGENSYEWILTYFSVVCGRNVIVPIDKDLSAKEIAQLLKDSDCRVMVYSQTYEDIIDELRAMGMDDIEFISMKTIPALLKEVKQLSEDRRTEYLGTVVAPDDLASIVYTSGTTGKSKGVMLTHFNLCSCAHGACCNVLNTGPVLLVLPLHHTFGLVASVFSVMYYGNPVYINQSLKKASQDFQKAKPQLVFVVPLILETLYKSIWLTAKKQGKDKALRVAISVSDTLMKFGIDLRKQLFKSVISSLGGNLDLIVSGGAPLDEKYVKAFRSFGITVLNGYGITECSPIVAVNRNQFAVPGSVGLPLCCNEVKISEEGEILVKGNNVMLGYYHDQKSNDEVFVDGWFRTGDLGFLDEYGALHITGRIKNLIILSNGENIPAEGIEALISNIPYVKEVIAYGENDLIVAEMFLDEDTPNAKQQIHEDIKALNQKLPLVKNIGKVVVRDTEFPKTTTKKIKRNYGGQ